MKKFFSIVLSLAVLVIAAYGIKYAMTPVNTQKLEYTTHETSINTNGFVMLDEWVKTSRSVATAYFFVTEGERVAKDSNIGELFYGDVSEERINELAAVDNKIKIARAGSGSGQVTEFDSTTVENNIYRRENDIIEAAAKNDVQAITKYKKDINSLRTSNTLSSEGELEELEANRDAIISNIGAMKEDIISEVSGIFTTYIDGYENRLSLAGLDSYDIAYFESLSQSPKTRKTDSAVEAGGEVCKIVNNHLFYVLMSVSSDVMEGHEERDSVKLRFNNMASAVVDGSIYRIGDEQNGRRLVTVRCPEYLENAFSYRVADVDLIFESYTGYRIPIQAVRTDEKGAHKVICLRDGRQYECECDIIYTSTDGGYVIAESTEGAANKLSQMDRIVVGER